MSTDKNADTRTVEEIRADIDRTRDELGGDVTVLTEQLDPRTRTRHLLTTAKTRTTAVAQQARATVSPRVRQAGQKANDNRLLTVAGALAVVAAAAVLVLQRRRAAPAQVSRNRRLPAFLSR
jgi:hypothetical protein